MLPEESHSICFHLQPLSPRSVPAAPARPAVDRAVVPPDTIKSLLCLFVNSFLRIYDKRFTIIFPKDFCMERLIALLACDKIYLIKDVRDNDADRTVSGLESAGTSDHDTALPQAAG